MSYLVYGENVWLVTKKTDQIVKALSNNNPHLKTLRLDPKQVYKQSWKELFSEKNLFGETTLFVFNNATEINKKTFIELLEQINKFKKIAIFWDNKEIRNKKIFSFFSPQNVFYFPLPKTIFKFLEAIGNQDKKYTLKLFKTLFQKEPENLIFYWLKRHFRELTLFSINPSLVKNLPFWKRDKICQQLKKITPEKTISFYQKLIEIEFRQKTGTLPAGLQITLANLILTI